MILQVEISRHLTLDAVRFNFREREQQRCFIFQLSRKTNSYALSVLIAISETINPDILSIKFSTLTP